MAAGSPRARALVSCAPYGAGASLTLCLLALAPLASARAQDGVPQVACESNYARAVSRALYSYRHRRFAQARALFEQAHACCPSARTLRGLGLVELELGRHVQSVELLRAALESSVRPLDDRLREQTTELLQRVETQVNHEQAPAPSSVPSVDTDTVTDAADVHLEPVPHEVAARMPESDLPTLTTRSWRFGEDGSMPLRLAPLRLVPLRLVPLRLVPLRLVPLPARPALLAAQPDEPASVLPPPVPAGKAPSSVERVIPKPTTGSRWLWTGLGVLVVSLALGLGLGTRPTQTGAPIAEQPIAIRHGP